MAGFQQLTLNRVARQLSGGIVTAGMLRVLDYCPYADRYGKQCAVELEEDDGSGLNFCLFFRRQGDSVKFRLWRYAGSGFRIAGGTSTEIAGSLDDVRKALRRNGSVWSEYALRALATDGW